jgi:hypothetical protein
MKVILVGVHHKPGLKPLDEQSKTGQTIAKLEKELEKKGFEVVKTNLYNTYALPKNEDREKLVQEWLNTNKPSGSIVVSLGTIVQQEIYPRQEEFGGNVIYETHPAALIWSDGRKPVYNKVTFLNRRQE